MQQTCDDLVASGFVVHKTVEITANVLHALAATALEKEAFFLPKLEASIACDFRQFTAMPGSRIYRLMESGSLVYMNFIVQKPFIPIATHVHSARHSLPSNSAISGPVVWTHQSIRFAHVGRDSEPGACRAQSEDHTQQRAALLTPQTDHTDEPKFALPSLESIIVDQLSTLTDVVIRSEQPFMTAGATPTLFI